MFIGNVRYYATPLFLLGALALLTACEETKRALGQTKEAPDEFTVYQRAPLSLPPNYGLRPPSPGAQRPQSVNPRDRAKKALGVPVRTADRSTAGHQQRLGKLSEGERAMLNLTGATSVDPGIRNLVDKDSARQFEEDTGRGPCFGNHSLAFGERKAPKRGRVSIGDRKKSSIGERKASSREREFEASSGGRGHQGLQTVATVDQLLFRLL